MNTRGLLCSALFGLFLTVQFLAAGCASAPDNMKQGGVRPGVEPEYAVLVLSDFPTSEENAAYGAGVAVALGTKKIIPSIPKTLKNMILKDPNNIQHIAKIMGIAGSIMQFDTLVVAIPTYGYQTKSFLGIQVSKYDVVATKAMIVDLDKMEFIAKNTHHSMYSKATETVSLTNAGREAMLHLIKWEK